MIGRLAAIAAVAGSALGAAIVLADEPAPTPRVPAVATAGATATPPPPRIEVRNAREVLRAPDPRGGAPWVVRRFTGVLPGTKHAIDCIQLGRVVDGRFGWLDGHDAFKPARPGSEWTTLCQSAPFLKRIGAQVVRFTTVDLATNAPRETVEWGLVAPGVTGVVPADAPRLTPEDGLVLRVTPGEAPPAMLTGTLEHADGRRTRFNRTDLPPRAKRRAQPVRGTEFVAAVAPDPAGGAPWGLIGSRSTKGGVCLQGPDALVGTRLGSVDYDFGVFFASPLVVALGCALDRVPTRAYPMRFDTLITGREGTSDEARRVERARIVFSGRLHPDVVSVTIRTPRDVRTLIPSPRAHAVLAVYAGRFPGANVTATARFRDGHTVTRKLYSE
jgi:hypothetical protein